jgi:hypothetical protein
VARATIDDVDLAHRLFDGRQGAFDLRDHTPSDHAGRDVPARRGGIEKIEHLPLVVADTLHIRHQHQLLSL